MLPRSRVTGVSWSQLPTLFEWLKGQLRVRRQRVCRIHLNGQEG